MNDILRLWYSLNRSVLLLSFLLFHPEDACQQYQGKCPLFSQSKERDLCFSSRCNSQRISALSSLSQITTSMSEDLRLGN